MQDIRSIGNGVGSLLGGGGRGGQPHLKPNYHHQGSLKCPRCGSLNTKFCYYNNYNLSQPRFLCKGCRRYWTKGGVLRNVPVGGGSHKTKHSKQKSVDGNPSSVSVASARQRKSTNSHKSSNISPEMPPSTLIEPVPTLFNQSFEPPMLTDKQFSEMGGFRSLMTSPSDELPPMTSWLTQQRDQDQIAAEDGGLFDQSYWLNNPDHLFSYFR